jgi:hypothetical protein
MSSAKTSDMTSAKTSHVTAAEATHVASAETAHVASAATSVASAAAAGLRTRSKKAAGKHCARQNHHHSSSHNILLPGWAAISAIVFRQAPVCDSKANANVAMNRRWGLLVGVPIKFPFNHPE